MREIEIQGERERKRERERKIESAWKRNNAKKKGRNRDTFKQ